MYASEDGLRLGVLKAKVITYSCLISYRLLML